MPESTWYQQRKQWLEQQLYILNYIESNLDSMTDDDMASHLGVSRSSVIYIRLKLGHCRHRRRPFTEDEEKYLREFASSKTISELAKGLGRSYDSVWAKCAHMGLRPISTHDIEVSIPAQTGYSAGDWLRYLYFLEDDMDPSSMSAWERDMRSYLQAKVTKKQRTYLIAYYSEGLTMDELAKKKGLDKSSVCRTLSRGRDNFVSAMESGADKLMDYIDEERYS